MHEIQVLWHTSGPKGAWIPANKQISLRIDMTDTQALCTLAHELGHALQLHPSNYSAKLERQADKWAANTLITLETYAKAEELHEGHLGAIAEELGVTCHLLQVWREVNEPQLRKKES